MQLRLLSFAAMMALGCAPSHPPTTDIPPSTRPWIASAPENRRYTLDGYAPSVRFDNRQVLGNARSRFAVYLIHVHNRIHPIFAEDFMGSLGALPADHPLNNPELVTRIEIVLERELGRVVRMGVAKSSGVTAFDIGALDSVFRASPFGKPDPALLSEDGNVYFHWEMHRDPVHACSTINARPYLLANRVGSVDAAAALSDGGVGD